ncbi:hypothetical protein BB559_005593 [Furculomyces boomerangus]|uniref:NADH:ubiquinone oxidoreductase 30kDa subunit domain-containing protein n=1 Tax=Furculomyces boomerangus TaxID=61424 RepID=A0A2T9Y7R8_9FUNG|nr:hypothetical protein BB559_005593 [Furculomyces boomerangus]
MLSRASKLKAFVSLEKGLFSKTPAQFHTSSFFKTNPEVAKNADPKLKDSDKTLYEFGKYLTSLMPKYIQQYSVWKDELTIYTSPEGLTPVMTMLRDHTQTQYKQLVDVTGADYPDRVNRFESIYNLLSYRYNTRIRVKTYASETSAIPSMAEVFGSANWGEREVWDMYGIFYSDHPDLRRILTDYGFEGHPLRKDFPVHGYVEVRYDEEKKRIVTEPIQFSQAFRNFDYSSAWEQTGSGRDATPDEFKKINP